MLVYLLVTLSCFSGVAAQPPSVVASGQEASEPQPTWTRIGEFSDGVRAFAFGPKEELYVGTTRSLYAWDLREGEVRWECDLFKNAPGKIFTAKGKVFRLWIPNPVFDWFESSSGTMHRGHGGLLGPATDGVVDPKARYIWLGAKDGALWRMCTRDVNTWSRRHAKNGGVTCMALDSKVKLLAIGGKDGTVRFLNPTSASMDKKKILKVGDEVTALAFHPKSNKLLVGTKGGSLQTWTPTGKKPRNQIQAYDKAIRNICVDPRGKWSVTADGKGAVKVWTLRRPKLALEIRIPSQKRIHEMRFIDDTTIVVARDEPFLTAWDLSEL